MGLVIDNFRGDPVEKLALVVMANHADDYGGSCYPGVDRVAQKIGRSAKQTRRIIHALIKSGLLAVIGNELGGRGASRRYQINVEMLTGNPPTRGSDSDVNTPADGRVSEYKASHPRERFDAKPSHLCAKTLPRTGVEPSLTKYKPSRNRQRRSSSPTSDGDLDFQRFWLLYPKKCGKQDALRAWAKLRPDAPTTERIIQQVERVAATPEWRKDGGRFIPHPATYLNGRRFDDEIAVTLPHQRQMVPL